METRFLHLTDLHLSHPDLADPHLHSDTHLSLVEMVRRIRDMSPQPDFVVISGDLTNQGDVASYQLLAEILNGIAPPVFLTLGNHDKRENFRQVFRHLPGLLADLSAPCFQSTHLGGLKVIALDTSLPGRVGGGIGEAQFAALTAELTADVGIAKLLVMHHPPLIDVSALRWESLDQKQTEELAKRLAGHHIVGILSGHIHINRVIHWHNIPVIISNGLHATIDPTATSGMQIEEGTGYASCVYRPSGLDCTFVPLLPRRAILGHIDTSVLRSFR